MITETTINLYPIIKYIGIFSIMGIALFLLHNLSGLLSGLRIFSKHDNNVIKQFLEKYPNVKLEFFQKSLREQNIENNQEIQQVNERIEHLEEYVEEINSKIDDKLESILKELHRG